MKKGLVMEGGAMRGMYTAGVTDVMMENNISFDGAIGVSAGAVFGCNYKSNQPGRAIRYNKKYCCDKRYVSFSSLIRTGDLYNVDFGYHQLPERLDPFDAETFSSSPMEFYVVCTDVMTGKAVYHKCQKGDRRDLEYMRASASMPMLSRFVEIDGMLLSDGGTSDSIPVRFFESIGYKHNVVILTQPYGFVKQKNKYMPIIRRALRKYPKLINALENRHKVYNDTLAYIEEKEKSGDFLVIRPSHALNVGSMEKDPTKLEEVYQLGREDALKMLEKVKEFVSKQEK